MKRVGVLALQDDFAEHRAALERADAVPVVYGTARNSGRSTG